jgi:hypothetical protein
MAEQSHSITRIWDGKDSLPRELQFIQPLSASDPQFARIMVSPRRTISVADAGNQSLAASATSLITFSANDLVAGSYSPPPAGVGLLFEHFRATIQATDTSAKLQITVPLRLALNTPLQLPLAPFVTPIPFTFPALATATYTLIAATPMPVWLPTDAPFANGPQAYFGLTNSDGAGAHTYQRYITYLYRLIYDIDSSKEKVYVLGTLT